LSDDTFGREVMFDPDGRTLMVSAVSDMTPTSIRSLNAVYTYVRNANGKYVTVQARRLSPEPFATALTQFFGRYVLLTMLISWKPPFTYMLCSGLVATDSFTAVGAPGDSSVVSRGGAVYASFADGEI
jgi:hypothetical protein